MTSLIISDRDNTPLTWGRFGQDIYSYARARESWARKTVMNGGFYDGYLQLPPDQDILEFFNNGLGYGIKEKDGSKTMWEGFVYEMVLRGNVDQIRSYRNLFNSVSAQSANYINNGGFETGTFADWTLTSAVDITIESGVGNVGRGSYSAKLTRGTLLRKMSQIFDCSANTTYRVSFYHWDFSGSATRYAIGDNTGAIVNVTDIEINDSGYAKFEIDFITHSGATDCTVSLYTSGTVSHILYIDDVKVERIVNGRPVSAVTSISENAESVALYGRKSKVLSRFPELTDAEAGRDNFLSYNAFPQTQRGNVSFSEPSLDIYVRGYIETLDWNLWTLQTGGHKQTPLAILQHIQGNNEFIDSIIVEGSPDSVFCPDPFLVTQENAVTSLMGQLGDTWKIGMKAGKQLVLEPLSFTPKYYMREGLLYPDTTVAQVGINEVNDRNVEPAIVRDLDSLLSGIEPESGYQDRRDFIMSSVEVSADNTSFGSDNIGRIKPTPGSDAVDVGDLFD